jgi:hypothetical protein
MCRAWFNDEIMKHCNLCTDRCRLTSFYGHLDAAGLRQLPESVEYLGLKIASTADIRELGGLTVWEGLHWLRKLS